MSLVSRRVPLIALFGVVLLLAAGVALATVINRNYEEQRLGEVLAQARILAATSTAALDFSDRAAAQEYVDALRANVEITAAGIYDASGRLFVSFPHPKPATLPGTYPSPEMHGDGLLNLTAAVRLKDKVLGTVLVQTVTEPLVRRLQRDGAIALLVAMAGLLLGVLATAEAALRRVNLQLAARATDLAEANRTLQEEIAAREKVEAALRQSQKMEAIGQLTGGIAHDFNNLLQVVLGGLERWRDLASRGGDIDPRLERMVNLAMQGAQRAAALTQRLLAFSRRQPLAPRMVDPNRLVTGMSDLLRRTLGETIQIETVLAGGLWRTLADENQLENALLNLAVNARDAMPSGGKLTIETGNAFLDEAYARAEQELLPGQYVMIAVSDTGTGMSPDILAKVFEPFFTTKDAGHGTGLGLSQVYGFIKQSGGHIKLYSELGQGTTVKLYLPRLLKATEEAGGDVVGLAVPYGKAGECILVVEDEESVRALTLEVLTDLGYRVVDAGDGQEALARLEGDPAISLLFTDVGLPGGMNGRQLADRAKQVRPDLKVLFTTGYARNAIVHQGRLDPGVELIGKPFSAADLARRVRAALDSDAVGGHAGPVGREARPS